MPEAWRITDEADLRWVLPRLSATPFGHFKEPVHRKTRTILAPRRGKPEDIAAMVRHLAGPHGRYITGQTIHINGGVYLP